MEHCNDNTTIAKLAQGDHEAFRSIFMHYFPKLKFFIARLVKSEAVAEELAQELFVKLWEKREILTMVQSFNAYLYRTAKNSALNYLDHQYVERKHARYVNESSEQPSDELLQAKEMELLIRLTVEKMPEQRKKIFKMSRTACLKNEEIAQKLNISKKTVENHLTLALKEIRQLFSMFLFLFL
jgi:RNA polymerase sigma-70 factor (ECF subfamily)